MNKILTLTLLPIVFLTGCASVELTPAGQNVQVVENVDESCESLGMVFGEGGSSWKGGAYYKNSSLLQYAQNDLKNKAAALGATHIVVKTSNFGHVNGRYGGTVTGANLSASSYKCSKDLAKK